MPGNLSASALRVQEALTGAGFSFKVVELPSSTRTSKAAAAAVGCDVECIAKSLVFRGTASGSPVLVIAGGANRVDEAKLAALVGESIGKADADYVRRHTGFAIGGVPPVGHINPLRTYIDRDLMANERVWAAAGTPHALFELKPADLPLMTGGEVVEVKE